MPKAEIDLAALLSVCVVYVCHCHVISVVCYLPNRLWQLTRFKILFYGAHLLKADGASACKHVQKTAALVYIPLTFYTGSNPETLTVQ
jgi:hypothetical protein